MKKAILMLLMLLVMVGSVIAIEVNISALEDTYVEINNPNTNYGALTVMRVGNQSNNLKISYLKFNITTLPLDSLITSAVLALDTQGGGSIGGFNMEIVIYGNTSNQEWVETEPTWNLPLGYNTSLTSDNNVTITASGPTYEWNVSRIVNASLLTGNENVTFILIGNYSALDHIDIKSKESGTPDYPRLTINYIVPTSCTSSSPTDGFGDAGPTSCGTGCCYNGTYPTAVCNVSGGSWYDYYDFGAGDGVTTDYCYNGRVYDCNVDGDCMAGYECNDYWECEAAGVDDVDGWDELTSGNPISAVFNMFDLAFAGWFVVILFFVFQLVLYMKTQNATLCWGTGIFFATLFAISTFVAAISVHIIFTMLALELAGIIYVWVMK